MGRKSAEHVFDEVSLRLDDDDRPASRGVLKDQLRQQRRLPDACRADDVEVVASIFDRQSEHSVVTRRVRPADDTAAGRDAIVWAEPSALIAWNPWQRFVAERPGE